MSRAILITMRAILLILILIIPLTGCTKLKQLAHLQPLLTLKGFSEEKKKQTDYIKARDRKFEELMKAAEEGDLASYKNQKKIHHRFGPPVYETFVTEDGSSYEVWMYRYQIKYFDSPKLYLYFDGEQNLVKWEKKDAPEQTAKNEQTDGS